MMALRRSVACAIASTIDVWGTGGERARVVGAEDDSRGCATWSEGGDSRSENCLDVNNPGCDVSALNTLVANE
jgi:hypothetical protein